MISVEPMLDSEDNADAVTRDEHGPKSHGPLASGHATRSVARGAMAILSTQPLTWAVSLLSSILMPRFLGDQELGTYVVVLTIGSFVGTFAALGIPNFLIRRAATDPHRAQLEGGGALVLLSAASLLAAALVAFAALVSGIGARIGAVLYVGLVGSVLLAPSNVVYSLLNGQERHVRYAWFNVLSIAVPTCAGLAVLAVWQDLLLFVAVTSIASLPILIVGWRTSGFRLGRSSFDPRLWRHLIDGGLPFFGANVTLRIRAESDRLLLAALATAASVGWYGAAYRIISIPLFIPTLIVTPLLPALSRTTGDPIEFRHTLRRCLIAALALSLPIFAMLFALAPAIPRLLGWPDEFEKSVSIMLILAMQQPIVALDMVLGTALVALRRERRWLVAMVVAATLNVGLNIILIRAFAVSTGNGALGAAIVTVTTECVLLVGAFVLLPRDLLDWRTIWTCIRILFAGFLLVLATRLLMPVSVVIAISAGGAAFVIATLAFGILRPADVRRAGRAALARTNVRLRQRIPLATDKA